jgi:AcrR family transcriptional regulator
MQRSDGTIGPDTMVSEELSPKAAKLLAAASRILHRDGFAALSLDAVGDEAGEYKGSVRYYFKNKAGLIEALLRHALAEPHLEEKLAKVREMPPGRERLGRELETWRRMASSLEQSRMWLELLPHVTRDPQLGAEILEIYDTWRAMEVSLLSDDSPLSATETETAANLIGATIDGLQVLRVIDEKHDRSGEVLHMLGDMIDAYMRSRRQTGNADA